MLPNDYTTIRVPENLKRLMEDIFRAFPYHTEGWFFQDRRSTNGRMVTLLCGYGVGAPVYHEEMPSSVFKAGANVINWTTLVENYPVWLSWGPADQVKGVWNTIRVLGGRIQAEMARREALNHRWSMAGTIRMSVSYGLESEGHVSHADAMLAIESLILCRLRKTGIPFAVTTSIPFETIYVDTFESDVVDMENWAQVTKGWCEEDPRLHGIMVDWVYERTDEVKAVILASV